jgi:predicted double-glycine peptidase
MKTLPLLCALILLFHGCASGPTPLPEGAKVLSGVPFFPQEDYQCGPAVLATVMNYWYARSGSAVRTGVDEIAQAIYSPGARGVLPTDLENYPRKKGFVTEQFAGSISRLRENIDRGVPVILLVDYGLSVYQLDHFLVATGYTGDGIIVNSGRKERQVVSNSELEKAWKKTGYWALRLFPS